MKIYTDTSLLVSAYSAHADSEKAVAFMAALKSPLPFTPLHRHECRNALRLRVFRKEITPDQRRESLLQIEADLKDGLLSHHPVPWNDAFREAEALGAAHVEKLGLRSLDLLHIGIAAALKSEVFLTLDTRQAALAKAAGFRLRLP